MYFLLLNMCLYSEKENNADKANMAFKDNIVPEGESRLQWPFY